MIWHWSDFDDIMLIIGDNHVMLVTTKSHWKYLIARENSILIHFEIEMQLWVTVMLATWSWWQNLMLVPETN